MKCLRLSSFVVGMTILSGSAVAIEYPSDFSDFFDKRPEKVEIVVAGSNRSEQVIADVSYDSFQLKSSQKDTVKAVEDYLSRHRLSRQSIDMVVTSLQSGIVANPGCEGVLSSCIPKDIPGQPEFVFDFDNKLLKIFVSSDMLKTSSGEKEYYSPVSENQALVNWSNLYAYADENNFSANWINEALLGLPLGYVSLNTQYYHSSSDQDFDVQRFLYNYELNNTRAIIGYQDQNALSFNSTDFLNYGANYAGLSVSLGDSDNLLKGNQKALQRIFFFAPSGGQLEVYQGERLLLTQVVSSGEQSIGYDQLPTGTYTITLRLKQGTNVLFEEKRQVVNSSQFTMPVGSWAYRSDFGQLEKSSLDTNFGQDEYDEQAYARLLMTHRPLESLLIGAGVTSNGDNALGLLGGTWVFNDSISGQYTVGSFLDGDLYQFGQLNVSPVSFNMRRLDHNDLNRPDELVTALYGRSNFIEYGMGLSGEWFAGRTFINYFRYETEDRNSSSESNNLSLTWSHSLFGGEFSLNGTFVQYDSDHDAMNIGLNWRRNFGKDASVQLGTNFDRDGFAYTQNSVSATHKGENWSGTTTAGMKWYQDQDVIGEGSASVYGNTSKLRYDAYAFVNTDGNRSLSGSISGSQVLSSEGSALSNERGQAFISLEPSWNKPEDKDIELDYLALKNNRYWYSEAVSVGSKNVLTAPVYSEVEFELDVEAENVYAEEIGDAFFVTPGNYYSLKTNVESLESQVFVFNDINDEPIRSIRCVGEGCSSVEELSKDGVFRINFRADSEFKLVSEKRVCVYNPKFIGSQFVESYCLPGIDLSEDNIYKRFSSETEIEDNNSTLLFIGKYESTTEVAQLISRLNHVGLASRSFDVGNFKYVYVQYQNSYSKAQSRLLESLETYIVYDSVNTEHLFTLR